MGLITREIRAELEPTFDFLSAEVIDKSSFCGVVKMT